MLRAQGNKVICTHIDNGQDFFTTPVPQCDMIISNPPYSVKTEVLERLFEIGKPFAMLVGVVGLFESQRRFDMFKNNEFEIMYLNRRVAYLRTTQTRSRALTRPSAVYMYVIKCYQSRLSLKKFRRSKHLKLFCNRQRTY